MAACLIVIPRAHAAVLCACEVACHSHVIPHSPLLAEQAKGKPVLVAEQDGLWPLESFSVFHAHLSAAHTETDIKTLKKQYETHISIISERGGSLKSGADKILSFMDRHNKKKTSEVAAAIKSAERETTKAAKAKAATTHFSICCLVRYPLESVTQS